MSEQIKIHKFEQAGLGKAPFTCTGMHQRKEPFGTCALCGTAIRYCYDIQSSDDKQFYVGCECVAKTDDSGLVRQVKHYETESKKSPAQRERESAALSAWEIEKVQRAERDEANKIRKAATAAKFAWLTNALLPTVVYSLRETENGWTGNTFVSSVVAELLNGEDPTGYTTRKLNILREVYGKLAGRMNSKAYNAKTNEFDNLLGPNSD